MHSHYGLQEQVLLTAPLIIKDGSEKPGQQEIVLVLADFSFALPDQIFADLQSRRTHAMDMQGMRMPAMASKPDLNDVQYDAFLANSRTLADPEVVNVDPGGSVRLRIINGSSMSNYHISASSKAISSPSMDSAYTRFAAAISRSQAHNGWTSS